MDDSANVVELLEELSDNIDDLEAALEPLLKTPISTLSKDLAPIEKAKLLTWLTYTIETILVSHIRLSGTKDFKNHPVMTELKRVKQYMQKVDLAENPVDRRTNMSLNKEAAGRFIKHGLAGNDRYDMEVAERKAREAEGARRKLQQLGGQPPSYPIPIIDRVAVGNGVSIKMKKTRLEAQGIVQRVRSNTGHKDGVLVQLEDGRNGRVRTFVDEAIAREASESFQNKVGSKKKRKADGLEEDEVAASSDDDDEEGQGDAMEVDEEDKPTPNKAKLSPEKKKKAKDKRTKKQKEGA